MNLVCFMQSSRNKRHLSGKWDCKFQIRLKQIHVLHIFFDVHVLALSCFVVSCCVTVLEQKVLCSVAIFQSSQRLNALSLGCVFPTSNSGNQFMGPQLFHVESQGHCAYFRAFFVQTLHTGLLVHPIAMLAGITSQFPVLIPCTARHLLLLKIAKYFLWKHSREDFKLRVTWELLSVTSEGWEDLYPALCFLGHES